MAKMNPKVKRKWVAALRSGKYKQGRNALRDENDRFCCLGVLCNLHAQAHPEIAQYEVDPGSYMGSVGFPPPEVVEWADLDGDDPEVTIDGERVSLAQLNDGKHCTGDGLPRSFKRIARIIEEQL